LCVSDEYAIMPQPFYYAIREISRTSPLQAVLLYAQST
jgi:hypothetical protein